MKRGQFNEALAILRPLQKDNPRQTEILFLIGLSAVGVWRQSEIKEPYLLDEAINVFRKILINRPGLVRVRLELARAFFLKGEDGLSREHFERVLAGKHPSAVVSNVRRYLNEIRARRKWSAYFGFTLAPDTNINSASDEDIIYINIGGVDLPFTRGEDSGAKSGVGALLWGGGQYQQPLGERLRLRIGTDISRREYKEKRFDQTFLSAHLGPRWLAGRNTELSLLASANHRWVAHKRYSYDLGGRLEVYRRMGKRWTLDGRASIHQRKYKNNNSLDGPVSAFSLGGTWFPLPVLRTQMTIGYNLERPKAVLWRNDTRWARLGFSAAVPYGFTVGGSGEIHSIRYERPYFSNRNRKDRLRVFRVSLFNRAFTVLGFSPQVVLIHEERKSNSQLQSYKRNRAELRFVKQF